MTGEDKGCFKEKTTSAAKAVRAALAALVAVNDLSVSQGESLPHPYQQRLQKESMP